MGEIGKGTGQTAQRSAHGLVVQRVWPFLPIQVPLPDSYRLFMSFHLRRGIAAFLCVLLISETGVARIACGAPNPCQKPSVDQANLFRSETLVFRLSQFFRPSGMNLRPSWRVAQAAALTAMTVQIFIGQSALEKTGTAASAQTSKPAGATLATLIERLEAAREPLDESTLDQLAAHVLQEPAHTDLFDRLFSGWLEYRWRFSLNAPWSVRRSPVRFDSLSRALSQRLSSPGSTIYRQKAADVFQRELDAIEQRLLAFPVRIWRPLLPHMHELVQKRALYLRMFGAIAPEKAQVRSTEGQSSLVDRRIREARFHQTLLAYGPALFAVLAVSGAFITIRWRKSRSRELDPALLSVAQAIIQDAEVSALPKKEVAILKMNGNDVGVVISFGDDFDEIRLDLRSEEVGFSGGLWSQRGYSYPFEAADKSSLEQNAAELLVYAKRTPAFKEMYQRLILECLTARSSQRGRQRGSLSSRALLHPTIVTELANWIGELRALPLRLGAEATWNSEAHDAAHIQLHGPMTGDSDALLRDFAARLRSAGIAVGENAARLGLTLDIYLSFRDYERLRPRIDAPVNRAAHRPAEDAGSQTKVSKSDRRFAPRDSSLFTAPEAPLNPQQVELIRHIRESQKTGRWGSLTHDETEDGGHLRFVIPSDRASVHKALIDLSRGAGVPFSQIVEKAQTSTDVWLPKSLFRLFLDRAETSVEATRGKKDFETGISRRQILNGFLFAGLLSSLVAQATRNFGLTFKAHKPNMDRPAVPTTKGRRPMSRPTLAAA
jgi:hypothetical protein